MESIIKINNLSKKYGAFTAVDALNLNIKKGEIFGLLGPNGAGKSTSILMLLGLTEPSAGSATVCGVDPISHPIDVKRRVGYLPEDVGFYNDMTASENLMFTARLNSIDVTEATERVTLMLQKVGLEETKDKKVGQYSKGMRQRLGLADVLIKEPEVIILDEPTTGIDPQGVKEILSIIEDLRQKEGMTVLFSSHNLHQVQQVCDRVGIFVQGKLLAQGDLESLSKQLFSEGQYVLSLELDPSFYSGDVAKDKKALRVLLKNLQGIRNIDLKEKLFIIESDEDISLEVSKNIFQGGYTLKFFSPKKNGLDEIYNHYFEGGKLYENR